jgi:hypothetical protein
MPFVVTANATIMCAHGGRVTLMPKQTTVQAGGGMVLRETDLMGAPIVGCAQAPSVSTKPCTTVVSVIPGSGTALKVQASGMPVHTQTLSGITDGVPPGTIMVVDPGQAVVQAS